MKITPRDREFLNAMKIDADIPDSVSPQGEKDAVFAELVAAEVAAENWKRVAELERRERVYAQNEAVYQEMSKAAWRFVAVVFGAILLVCMVLRIFG